ncbi:MAG: hypothetical protein BMS9Abin15_0530 [Gammaproteobacteria bacterium]|nr:MAG: hypothetical protein BMS9Abin15_0530 [Gammaproteobacteria bacterium]
MTDLTHLTKTRFDNLPLDPLLLKGLADMGFTHCTPIQSEALPRALAGGDVAGQAQTGTGKTAAFLLATLQYLITHPANPQRLPQQPRALILAPTRELAVQIHRDAIPLNKHTGFRLGLIYGGSDYQKQQQHITDGVDILIGTPGRLIDFHRQKLYDLKALQVIVMDEADRMFDLGFIRDIRYLLRRMPSPEKRLGLLFSATLSHRVLELSYEHMNDPELIRIDPEKMTVDEVRQGIYYVADDEKIPLLLGILNTMNAHRTIVFVNTKRAAEQLYNWLEGNDYKTAVLSGDVPQKKRLQLLENFSQGKLPILIATDVAARGLHIPDVSHVINFDLPQDSEDYVHRIGRTARLGAEGDAISFACERYSYSLPDIENYIGRKIPMHTVTPDLLATLKPPVKKKRDRLPQTRHARKPQSQRRPRNKGMSRDR